MQALRKNIIIVWSILSIFFIGTPEICFAQEGSREGGQTPVQIAIQIVLTTLILKLIEPKIMP
jgi:hypothetical protein